MFLASSANPSLPVFIFCIEICVYFQLVNTPSSLLDSFTCSSGQLNFSSGVLTSHCIQFKGQVPVESLVGCLEHLALVAEGEKK